MFLLTADIFLLRNHTVIYLGFFLACFFFFFCENYFDGDVLASPGPRKVESLDLINNSVRKHVHLEEKGAWA